MCQIFLMIIQKIMNVLMKIPKIFYSQNNFKSFCEDIVYYSRFVLYIKRRAMKLLSLILVNQIFTTECTALLIEDFQHQRHSNSIRYIWELRLYLLCNEFRKYCCESKETQNVKTFYKEAFSLVTIWIQNSIVNHLWYSFF